MELYNNVKLNDISHEAILKRHKPVTIEECLKNKNDIFDEWFEIKKKIIQYEQKKCLSLSFFKKNVDNLFYNQYEVNNEYWYNKYVIKLFNNLDNFKHKDIMCINIYLASDLEEEYLNKLLEYNFVNVYVMVSESIGAQPGMMWRFMDFTNKDYDSVYCLDIDHEWSFIDRTLNNNNKLCTVKPADGKISNNWYNFTTIMGGLVKTNPHKFNYNIIDIMKGFIIFSLKRQYISKKPYLFYDDEKVNVWNKKEENNIHSLGWGKLITVYGFDETFLKYVLYYDCYPDILFI